MLVSKRRGFGCGWRRELSTRATIRSIAVMELEKNQRLWNLKKIKIHAMCQWLIIVIWLIIVGSALTLLVGLELLIIVGHPIIVGLALLVIAGRFRFKQQLK